MSGPAAASIHSGSMSATQRAKSLDVSMIWPARIHRPLFLARTDPGQIQNLMPRAPA